MDSPAEMRKRYQRFFAWSFVLATMLALGLFWMELAFPLLVALIALVASLAPFVGLISEARAANRLGKSQAAP
jgi:predicted PurR-regulated permease PerM